jgi:hypothetical protein
MVRGIKVPKVTCVRSCLSKAILDHPMKGVNKKRAKRVGVLGKRNMREVKSMVEYVMCPDIFQKNVMRVVTEEIKKIFKDILVNISKLKVVSSRKSMPKIMVMVEK